MRGQQPQGSQEKEDGHPLQLLLIGATPEEQRLAESGRGGMEG